MVAIDSEAVRQMIQEVCMADDHRVRGVTRLELLHELNKLIAREQIRKEI